MWARALKSFKQWPLSKKILLHSISRSWTWSRERLSIYLSRLKKRLLSMWRLSLRGLYVNRMVSLERVFSITVASILTKSLLKLKENQNRLNQNRAQFLQALEDTLSLRWYFRAWYRRFFSNTNIKSQTDLNVEPDEWFTNDGPVFSTHKQHLVNEND